MFVKKRFGVDGLNRRIVGECRELDGGFKFC